MKQQTTASFIDDMELKFVHTTPINDDLLWQLRARKLRNRRWHRIKKLKESDIKLILH